MYPTVRVFRSFGVVVAIAIALAVTLEARADDEGWPREITAQKGKIVIYQPQVESFEGNTLESRAAVAVTVTGSEPVFGAIWMTARVSTDRDNRTVTILDIKVPNVRFPDGDEQHQQALARFLEQEIPKWDLTLSLDRLLASIEITERQTASDDGIKTAPPVIRYVDYPAVLVTIEGDPILQEIEGSSLTRVINTAFNLVLDSKTRRYYLDGGAAWYVAEDVMGPWEVTEKPPAEVAALRSAEAGQEVAEIEEQDPETADQPPPAVIVATEPTELISSDGEPEYSPIGDTDLLYMTNTDSIVAMNIATQQYFTVLAGRWYAGKSLEGPWAYVPPDRLPAGFADIPPDSDLGDVLAFVAGTDEARDAVLDNSIPQTSAIQRSEATLSVTYDGEPKFEPIEDTEMKFAVNTESSVILVHENYYACNEAVWFVSHSPKGPWVVADEIPDEIYTLPPSSPVYNTKYVYVYDSTPEVVYVGYTGGYTSSYVYHSCVVYGTGWYYQPWYGSYYYPRHRTWGFSVRYNPWYGWSFGLSWSNGPFTFTIGRGGWYGGGWGGYRAGYRHGARHGYRAGYNAGQRQAHRDNVYNKPENRKRNADRPAASTRPSANTAQGRPNNVYTDKNGNVYRRNDDGWQKRDGDGWSKTDGVPGAGTADRPTERPSTGTERPSTGAARPATGAERPSTTERPSTGSTRPSTGSGSGSYTRPSSGSSNRASGLERDYQSRQRGTSRTQSYNHSRSGASRGGSRGGGGRRR
jgi:hypothetical protein